MYRKFVYGNIIYLIEYSSGKINHFLNKKIFFICRITTERFLKLAAELGAIFRHNRKLTIVLLSLSEVDIITRTAANAGGMLYEKYLKYRKRLIKCDIIKNKRLVHEGIMK